MYFMNYVLCLIPISTSEYMIYWEVCPRELGVDIWTANKLKILYARPMPQPRCQCFRISYDHVLYGSPRSPPRIRKGFLFRKKIFLTATPLWHDTLIILAKKDAMQEVLVIAKMGFCCIQKRTPICTPLMGYLSSFKTKRVRVEELIT